MPMGAPGAGWCSHGRSRLDTTSGCLLSWVLRDFLGSKPLCRAMEALMSALHLRAKISFICSSTSYLWSCYNQNKSIPMDHEQPQLPAQLPNELATGDNQFGGENMEYFHISETAEKKQLQAPARMSQAEIEERVRHLEATMKENTDLFEQIKAFNHTLDTTLKKIDKKKFKSTEKYKPRVRPQRSPRVQQKFNELDSVKRQLQIRRYQKSAVAELISKVDRLKSEYKQKFLSNEQKRVTLRKLQQMVKKQIHDDQADNPLKIYSELLSTQTKQIKTQIHMQTSKINQQKERFISAYKRKARSKSVLGTGAEPEVQHLGFEANEKNTQIRQRVDSLRKEKQMLQMKIKSNQRWQYLNKLRAQYSQLHKN